jgi:hypothetical protein
MHLSRLPLPPNYTQLKRDLDDLELRLTGMNVQDPPLPGSPVRFHGYNAHAREFGLDWPSTALTMVGSHRLHNFRKLIERVIRSGVPGDIIETGVWRGGASILARAVLKAWGVTDRRILLADSFQGLPPPDESRCPADQGSDLHTYEQLAVSLEQVRANFEAFGLLDEQVVFMPGWFRDTMPNTPSSCLAVIRLDGDMYESTIDPLVHLYDRLSPGGWVIVDDYSLFPGCKAAVQDFFAMKKINPRLRPIDKIGVYFRKE